MAAGNKRKRNWYDYLWIWSIIYFSLGFFNILFAWLGMIDFLLPLLFATFGGNKWFCNHMCGRSQLFVVLGKKMKCSRNRPTPKWMYSGYFRYGFLLFFLTMFGIMLLQTYQVFSGASTLKKAVKLLWTFRLPWEWAYSGSLFPDWVAQFGYGFYSVMLTSAIIGLAMMLLYRERSWCAFCPMGTMTQGICKIKQREKG